MDDEILTAEQVANIIKVHRFTVLKFIKQGKLKASKLGRVYRIRKSDVDRFLDNQIEKRSEVTKKASPKKKVATKKTANPQPQSDQKREKLIVETKEEKIPPRKNDNDVDHYVLKIHDHHDI